MKNNEMYLENDQGYVCQRQEQENQRLQRQLGHLRRKVNATLYRSNAAIRIARRFQSLCRLINGIKDGDSEFNTILEYIVQFISDLPFW